MKLRVLVLGGYGNFGKFITSRLAAENNLNLIVAGRNPENARHWVDSLQSANPVDLVALDINDGLDEAFSSLRPDIVIHACGPFQDQIYNVALACIEYGCHYIDLADGRAFVNDIESLNPLARKQGVLVVSGASSVPALTCAIVDEYIDEFKSFESIDFAISTAQPKANGLATVEAILKYTGKPFTTLRNGKLATIFGWQGLRSRKFWGLGSRLLGNCDIPDLDLLPKRYPSIQSIRFQAGIESHFQHFGLFLLSWLVRGKLLKDLTPLAKILLAASQKMGWFDKNQSGYYLEMSGVGLGNNQKTLLYEIVAKDGDGINIPCVPSIVLAKKIATKALTHRGAVTAGGLLSLAEFMDELKGLKIKSRVNRH